MKNAHKLRAILLAASIVMLTGCASTPMASKDQDAASKTFSSPKSNMSGLYVYRNSSMGAALLKKVSLDKSVIGTNAANTFLHREIVAGEHAVSTQSEFSDNNIQIRTEPGKNYFVRQYIKFGVMVGGADLELMSEDDGKKGVLDCKEAI